jgi:uncharacterized protein involved in exopolysaccharide biosynthesis
MVATQQSFSISRRALDVEDYIDIARRHAAWIIGPAFFGTVAAICIAFTLQNKYISTAMMQIRPPQISGTMVATTISSALNERIQLMEQEILSRDSLGGIISDPHLNLYKDELKSDKILEDVVEEMKSNIDIHFVSLPGALGQQASAFQIAFKYPDRIKARQVVEALMTKFTDENLRTQKTYEDQTNSIVGDLSKGARADLQQANEKLTQFRLANPGKLPETVNLNIARQTAYNEKLRAVTDQIFRDNQSVAQLETAKAQQKGALEFYEEEQAEIRNSLTGPNAVQQNPELVKLDAAIDGMEFQIQTLEKQFSDSYPGIKNAKKQLQSYKDKREEVAKKAQAKAEADAAKAAEDAGKPKIDTAANINDAKVRHQYQQQIDDYEAKEKLYHDDIARLTEEQEGYKKASAKIDEMLTDSTGLEAQYEDLIRNRNLAEASYNEYLVKQHLSAAEGELIDRKAGETLEVLDNASVPNEPVEPNRKKIIGVGFAMSLILGLGMAGLQEAKDTSLKNLKDVRAYTHLPVLCSVPLLENTMLVKRKRRLTYLAWSAAVLVGAAAVGASVVYYMTVVNATKG